MCLAGDRSATEHHMEQSVKKRNGWTAQLSDQITIIAKIMSFPANSSHNHFQGNGTDAESGSVLRGLGNTLTDQRWFGSGQGSDSREVACLQFKVLKHPLDHHRGKARMGTVGVDFLKCHEVAILKERDTAHVGGCLDG